MEKVAVVAFSGGMDSTVLAYKYKADGCGLHLVGFNYGQRHSRELVYAARTAEKLGAEFHVVNLESISPLLQKSVLIDGRRAIPAWNASLESTVVPNRNAIILSICWGHAVSCDADVVAIGVHRGDKEVYPDCRVEFILATKRAFQLGCHGIGKRGLILDTPFIASSKVDVVRMGNELGVPWEDTYSCYEGGVTHCGVCSACHAREESLRLADMPDMVAPVRSMRSRW
jgi:7-cyano-7-deazaguanine synthase